MAKIVYKATALRSFKPYYKGELSVPKSSFSVKNPESAIRDVFTTFRPYLVQLFGQDSSLAIVYLELGEVHCLSLNTLNS